MKSPVYFHGTFFMFERLANIRHVNVVKELALKCSDDVGLVDELIEILVNGKGREIPVASWVLNHAVEINPGILNDKRHKHLIDVASASDSGTIKRNLIRNWQFSIPEDESLKFDVIELALKFLNDRKQDLAVRVFSITVLENYLEFMPELMNEVLFILEREMPDASASFGVRAKRFIKKAERLSRKLGRD